MALRITTSAHWSMIERQIARRVRHAIETAARHGKACGEVADIAQGRAAELAVRGMTRAQVADLADRRAELMADRIAALPDGDAPEVVMAWLNDQLAPLQGGAFRWTCRLKPDVHVTQCLKRAADALWWRRRLWVVVMRASEGGAIAEGRVCDKRGEWYASNEAVTRRRQQVRRNRMMLERTELENEDGERYSLAELSDLGPANKAIRRGELMTRVRGCEEYAEAHGHPGVFLALTTPSRFHRTLHHGPPNPNWDGSTPRDAQAWLRARWAATRSAVARAGATFYGFRVAEPHHDGCTHWHALLWAESEAALAVLCMLIRRYWLELEGDERGARERRVSMERMLPGGATGYCAKYISKNIDDVGAVGIEGHKDGDATMQGDLFASGAMRVEAWAAHWGIRQFQAIGQPPVTVWRELRRIKPDDVQAAPAAVQYAWDGVHKTDDHGACWHTYVEVQGGLGRGRDYRVGVAKEVREHHGRYGKVDVPRPIGVYERARPDVMVKSHRRTWTPRVPVKGAEVPAVQRARIRAARSAAPRTRFNNCTRHDTAGLVAGLLERVRAPAGAPFLALQASSGSRRGGSDDEISSSWPAWAPGDDGSSYAVPGR